MRKERIQTIVDSLSDKEGKVHNFVIAAVSEVFDSDEEPLLVLSDNGVNYFTEVVKGIKLGYAICNPIDDFNEEIGKQIAIGRARKNENYALYSTELGYINTKMVQAFLEQEAQYLKDNPDRKIAYFRKK